MFERSDLETLYYDTNNLIYVSRPAEYDQPIGDYLGQHTDELGGREHNVEFLSGGKPAKYINEK